MAEMSEGREGAKEFDGEEEGREEGGSAEEEGSATIARAGELTRVLRGSGEELEEGRRAREGDGLERGRLGEPQFGFNDAKGRFEATNDINEAVLEGSGAHPNLTLGEALHSIIVKFATSRDVPLECIVNIITPSFEFGLVISGVIGGEGVEEEGVGRGLGTIES